MATTEADVLDRVRTVVTDLGYTEASGLDMSRQPTGADDGVFAVTWSGLIPRGGMNFSEEARGTVVVSVLRTIAEDYGAARRTLLTDARSIINAIVRDGAEVSGDYAVEDAGRTLEIESPKGASYLIGRVRVPMNFEVAI